MTEIRNHDRDQGQTPVELGVSVMVLAQLGLSRDDTEMFKECALGKLRDILDLTATELKV